MPKTKKRKTREAWGRVRKLPSGRYQASYEGPDLIIHKAAGTFLTLDDARAWLRDERNLIEQGSWVAPARRNRRDTAPTLKEYAIAWLADRDLKPATKDLYGKHLRNHIYPGLGALPLDEITPFTIRSWRSELDTGPTAKAHAYSLVRTILNTAIIEELIRDNPCKIVGAGSSKRRRKIRPATVDELEKLMDNLPARYQAMVPIGAWCGLRFGEVIELRRSDFNIDAGIMSVRRGVTRVEDGRCVIGDPKSDAGIRDVNIPPHIVGLLRGHIDSYADRWFKCPTCTPEANSEHGRDGLLFPAARIGGHLRHNTFYEMWDTARQAAGLPEFRFHDLRHTSMTMAAATGATLAELMARAGHSTARAALLYQHAVSSRDADIAKMLSEMATGKTWEAAK